MHFAFTDDQQMIADTARDFFVESATSERTRAAMAADGFDRETWARLCGELGLAGVLIDERHGGAGLGMVEFASIAEAAGAQVAAVPLLGLAMASRALRAGGSADQQDQWLPALANGETVAAVALDAAVEIAGDRLSGRIDFVAHGAVATLLVVARGADAWLVDLRGPGVTVTPVTTMDQTRPYARIDLDDAPATALADGAAAAAREAGIVCLATEALGGAQAALDRTVAYAKDRIQFGRQIGSFQAYKHRLADMMVEIEQARSAVYWAACAVDEESPEKPIALHTAKAFCADCYAMVAGNAIQLHGGIGFTWEHDAHLFFKRARAIQSMLGNANWHRDRIADMILGDAA